MYFSPLIVCVSADVLKNQVPISLQPNTEEPQAKQSDTNLQSTSSERGNQGATQVVLVSGGSQRSNQSAGGVRWLYGTAEESGGWQ